MTSSPALNGSLTHEPDRFSDAAWDLLLSGQDVARRWRHEQLDVEHLIQVLFTDSACRRLVERLPLPIDALLDRLVMPTATSRWGWRTSTAPALALPTRVVVWCGNLVR